jgi:hypothetical protein
LFRLGRAAEDAENIFGFLTFPGAEVADYGRVADAEDGRDLSYCLALAA